MTARQVIVPGAMPSRDANGRNLPAKFRFYAPDSAFTTLKPVYTDNSLTVPLSQPILSDAAGRWPQIWADEAQTFDVGWTDQRFDRIIKTFTDVRPADDAVLASAELADGSAAAAADSAAAAAISADQAEDAAVAASSLVSIALTGAQDIGTVLGWTATIVPAVLKSLRVAGYRKVGDGGGGLWVRIAAAPSHLGKFRSLDRFMPDGSLDHTNGGWWELASEFPCPDQFGYPRDGSDAADYIDAAAAYALAKGGGLVMLLRGVYGFSRKITLPAGVSLRGAGGNARYDFGSVLRALAANAQLVVGGWGSANASFGGQIGDFVIDGNHVGTGPLLWVGRALERTFANIDIRNAVQDGMRVDEAQNCNFLNVNSEQNGGCGLVVDRGAGGNSFWRCEYNLNTSYAVMITETLGISTGNYATPTHNEFIHCILERSTGGTVLFHDSGFDNTFTTCVFAAFPTAPAPNVDVRNKVGFNGTSRLRFHDPIFSGNTAQSTALKVAAFSEVLLRGKPKFQGFVHALDIATNAVVDLDNYVLSVMSGTTFTGTGAEDVVVRQRSKQPFELQRLDGANVALLLEVLGETGARYRLRADGTMGWGDGSGFSYDVNLFRQAAGILGTSSTFYAQGGLGSGDRVTASALTGLFQAEPVHAADGSIVGYRPIYGGFTP